MFMTLTMADRASLRDCVTYICFLIEPRFTTMFMSVYVLFSLSEAHSVYWFHGVFYLTTKSLEVKLEFIVIDVNCYHRLRH